MKYVIVSVEGIELAVVFPDSVQHRNAVDPQASIVVSAGFCKVDMEAGYGERRVSAWGQSTSLKVKARPDDHQVIEFSLMNMGILSAPVRINRESQSEDRTAPPSATPLRTEVRAPFNGAGCAGPTMAPTADRETAEITPAPCI